MGEQGSGAVASKTKELPRRDDGVEIAVSLDRPRQIAVVHQDRPRRHSGPERKACYPVGDFVLYLAPNLALALYLDYVCRPRSLDQQVNLASPVSSP